MKLFSKILLKTLFLLMLAGLFSRPASAQFYQGCTEIDQIPEEECIALERLYQKTQGERWFKQGGWLLANQPCSWFGVTCNSKDWPLNVIKIELVDNNVGGTLPGELGLLPELEVLRIENTTLRGGIQQVSGLIPSALAEARNLKQILLGNNLLIGSIPATLSRLDKLEELDLHENKLSGFLPDSLQKLTNLKSLNLSKNELKGVIPPSYGRLDSLSSLDLSHNLFNGPLPDSLANLTALRNLRLDNNNFSGPIPASIGRLPNLLWLSLNDNNFSGALHPDIAASSQNFSFCSMENNSIDFCFPDQDIYKKEDGLLCGVPVTSSCTRCVGSQNEAQCKSLEQFYYATEGYGWLENNNWLVHNDPCQWFGIGCSQEQITELSLPQNNLTGTLPSQIASLSNLEHIDLSGNKLEGAIPLDVVQLATDLSACTLVDNSPSLCIPNSPAYTALNVDPVCGLPLLDTCMPASPSQIQLSFFLINKDVTLSWIGSPTAIYLIERSVSGMYEQVAQISKPAHSDNNFIFQIPDSSPGLHRYRVKQLLPDNTEVISNEVVVLLGGIPFALEPPFPNPFSSSATIEVVTQDRVANLSISLFDAQGREITVLYEGALEAGYIVPVQVENLSIAAGLYFIKADSDSYSAVQPILYRP